MADLSKTVQIIFSGKDNFSGTADSVNKRVALLAGGFESGVSAAASFTGTLLKLEAALAAAAVVMGGAAYKAAINYEFAVANLDKVYNDSEISQDAFLASLNKIPIATNDAVASAADWIKANKSASEALKLVAIDADFVIAAELEQAQSTETLKVITESYGFTADQLREKLNFLNTVSDNSATTVKLLAEAVGGSAQAAELAGLSFEELVAFLTPAVAKTQQGAEVGRAFRTVLAALIKPTEKQTEVLNSLGVSLEDSNGRATTAAERFRQLLPALENADEATRQYGIATIAGADQLARFAAAATGVGQANDLLAGKFKTVVTLEQEANRIRSTSIVQLQQLNKAFTDFAVSIGGQYEDSVDGIIVALTDLLRQGRELVLNGDFSEFFDLINKGLNKLQIDIEAITKNLPAALKGVDFSPFLDSLRDVGGAISGVFNFDLTTTEGLRDAIQVVVNLLAKLTDFAAGAVDGLSPFIAAAGDLITSIAETDASVISFIGSIGGVAIALDKVLPSLNTALLAVIAFGGTGGAAALASTAFATLTGSISSLIGVLNGPLGLIALAGAAGYAVGSVAEDILSTNDKFIEAADSVFGFVDSLVGIERGVNAVGVEVATAATDLSQFAKKTNEVKQSTDELGQELFKTGSISGVTADQLDAATESAELFAKEQAAAAAAVSDSNEALSSTAEVLTDIEKAQRGLIPWTQKIVDEWRNNQDALDKVSEAQAGVNRVVVDGVEVYTQVSKAQDAANESLKDLAESGEIAKDKYAELVVELQKAEIEAKVKLDIAEVEAGVETTKAQLATFKEVTELKLAFDIEKVKSDTEKVKALITGITDSAEIVSSNIQKVIDAIAGLDDADKLANDKFKVFRDQLELENKRLDEQLNNQTRLTDAQIKELEARTNRLRSGEAVIKIDGGQLQTHLEAFMFEILSAIRVKANGEAQSFLLGIAG